MFFFRASSWPFLSSSYNNRFLQRVRFKHSYLSLDFQHCIWHVDICPVLQRVWPLILRLETSSVFFDCDFLLEQMHELNILWFILGMVLSKLIHIQSFQSTLRDFSNPSLTAWGDPSKCRVFFDCDFFLEQMHELSILWFIK